MENKDLIQTASSIVTLVGLPVLLKVSFQVGRILERFDNLDRRVTKLERKTDKELPRIHKTLAQIKGVSAQ